jgi:hypothetical protein
MKIEEHPLYPTSFLVGHRNTSSGPEKVGALIVKGTFHGLASPDPAPKEEQVPVLMSDVPFLIPNGDFEDASLNAWTTTAATLERVEHDERWWARLTSAGSDALMSQTFSSSTPLTGRYFIMGFEAWIENLESDETLEVEGFRLESVTEPPVEICRFSAELSGDPKAVFSDSGEWPALGTASSFTVILVGTGDPGRPVYFDKVQIHEDVAQVRYENDLAVFKPHADVVVLGASEAPGGSTTGTWHVVMEVNGGSVEKAFVASGLVEIPTRTIFGWASTAQDPRLEQAGEEEELKAFDPSESPLPESFQNVFFNGFDRTLTGSIPLSYLPDGASLEFRTERRPTPPGAVDHLFTVALPEMRPHATLTVLDGGDQQDVLVPLVLDTVVIEPDLHRFTVIWRGTWGFDPDHQLGVLVTGGPE